MAKVLKHSCNLSVLLWGGTEEKCRLGGSEKRSAYVKKIEAIIRPEKLGSVLEALHEIGYPGMTITEVKGHGKQKGLTQQWRGREYKVNFLPKTKVEVVVLEEDVGPALRALVRAARTEEAAGDGKIFVLPVENAVRVRTGDYGDDAI